MATQNQYNPEVVQLVGGLDFVTPRPSVAPGSLIDSYNFEVSDRLGYNRVTGIEPFDGHASISSCYTSLYTATYSSLTGGTISIGKSMWLSGDSNTSAFGIVTSATASPNTVTFFVYDILKFYKLFSGQVTTINFDGVTTAVLAPVKSHDIFAGNTTITQAITDILSAYSNIYNKISIAATQSYEGGSIKFVPPVGLHWFEDQLYSITDLDSILFDTGVSQVLPNDILKNGGAGVDILVCDVQLVSGSWSSGNAAGKILYRRTLADSYVPTIYNARTNTTVFTNVPDATTLDILRGATTLASAVHFRTTISGTIPPTWMAGLSCSVSQRQFPSTTFGANAQGWHDIDIGYQFAFNSGTVNGPPTAPGRVAVPVPASLQTVSSLVGTSGVTVVGGGVLKTSNAAPGGGNWSATSLTTAAANADLAVLSDAKFIRATVNNAVGPTAAPLLLSNFSFTGIPTDAVITGITVNGGVWMTNAGGGVSQQVAQVSIGIPGQTTTPTSKNSPVITPSTGAPSNTFALGNSGDQWGIDNLSPSTINGLLVQVTPYCTKAGTVAIDFHLDYLQVVVTYQISSSVYYFWNGTDDVQAVITNTNLQTGTFAGANATGVMQVAQVQPYLTSARSQIGSGDVIHSLPGGTGLIIATVTSNMTFAGLPSLSSTAAKSSRYEMIDANFYGNKDWSAIYGVSGAGRAFVYDSFFFRYIYTGLSDILDIPRHIAFHNFHLCLGYQVGTVLTSATGLPEDFSGLDGAAEFDTGDAVTGLLRMSGTSLGIFCQKTIQSLNGTDNNNFSISILMPDEGAIEYTVANCGKPIYASNKGISTLDQSEKYGNFLGNRLSAQITPWLVPRLTQVVPKITVDSTVSLKSVFTNSGLNSPLFCQVIRSKNQYRLWFADGYFLTMTLMGAAQSPVFSLGQINFGSLATPDILIPLAASSAIDSAGLERNHVSYYNKLQGYATTQTDTKNYVYELERGWGWAKTPITAWFTTTHNFYDNPFQIDRIAKIRLHGQSLGAASLAVAVSANYLSNDFTFGNLYGQTASNAVPQDISLPVNGFANAPATLSSDYQAMTNIATVAKRGRSFSMQFSTNPATIEPPSVAQALLIQITENKADV